MHRILILPDIRLNQKPDTGYPVMAGYRISGRILGLTNGKISNKFVKNNYTLLLTSNEA
jgi:hypothetical protein